MIGGLNLELLQDWLKNVAITTHADVSKAQNSAITAGVIWVLIALFLTNQIAPIVHDFKMNIIIKEFYTTCFRCIKLLIISTIIVFTNSGFHYSGFSLSPFHSLIPHSAGFTDSQKNTMKEVIQGRGLYLKWSKH